ncbi:hypothetical protein PPL_04577 [Heterostelium album PN500]|uniref:Endonuclease/exonuclease/phosphatase domain-containing protein n=1 Tax=Heterostelium pallidum (strain ATCC 26659 / Pp 5 / PN500) TaxID=670386 RepID=D3B7Y9_HETP5|nr:hypothetical protein PPL_04577 [Heterostelium album PN500]EFA82157.1 hypothetical protein PPL_04577 [Heterostelium album PN500]|eukprot:XP_020434274.1 hypothetical protein PPL_04577 [Heterostelium album PN500]
MQTLDTPNYFIISDDKKGKDVNNLMTKTTTTTTTLIKTQKTTGAPLLLNTTITVTNVTNEANLIIIQDRVNKNNNDNTTSSSCNCSGCRIITNKIVVDNNNNNNNNSNQNEVYITSYNTGVEGGKGGSVPLHSALIIKTESKNININFPNIVLIQEITSFTYSSTKNILYEIIGNQPDVGIAQFNKRKANQLAILYHTSHFNLLLKVKTIHRFQIAVFKLINTDLKFVVINMHLPKKAEKSERDETLFVFSKFMSLLKKSGVAVVCGGDFNHDQSEIASWRDTFDLDDEPISFLNCKDVKTTESNCIDHIIVNKGSISSSTVDVFKVTDNQSVNHKAVRSKLYFNTNHSNNNNNNNNSNNNNNNVDIQQLYRDSIKAWEDFRSEKRKVKDEEKTTTTTTTTTTATTTNDAAPKKFQPLSSRLKKTDDSGPTVQNQKPQVTKPKFDSNSSDLELAKEFKQRWSHNIKSFFTMHFPNNLSAYRYFLEYSNNKFKNSKYHQDCRDIIHSTRLYYITIKKLTLHVYNEIPGAFKHAFPAAFCRFKHRQQFKNNHNIRSAIIFFNNQNEYKRKQYKDYTRLLLDLGTTTVICQKLSSTQLWLE